MSHFRLASRAALVSLALAAPVFADAPVGGVDQQYDNFDYGDRIITDRFTRLVWNRQPSSAPYPAAMTFEDAKASCAPPKRLPSLKELITIVDEAPRDRYDNTTGVTSTRWIDWDAFRGTPPEEFWTSSITNGKVWTVDFGAGTTQMTNPTDLRRVRCVDYVAK